MSWKRWRLALYAYPIRLIAVFFLAGLFLVALGAAYVEERERQGLVAYTERLMQTFVERQQHELEKLARDYAVWDVFAERVHGEVHDAEWLKNNITASTYRNFGIVDVLVLSRSHKPVYRLHRGEVVRPGKLAEWHEAFAAKLQHCQHNNPGRSSISGFVRSREGRLQLIVAERIRPEHRLMQEADSAWLVFTRNIDAHWLEETGLLLSVRDLRVTQEPPEIGRARYSLVGLDQRPLAWVSWRVDRRLLAGFYSRPLLFAVALLFLLALLLARVVLLAHRRQLEAQNRMLLQSEALRRLSRLPGNNNADELHYLNEVVQVICKVLGGNCSVTLWRVDSCGEAKQCMATSDAADVPVELFTVRGHADYISQLQERRLLLIEDVSAETRFPALGAYWRIRRTITDLGVAVMVRGRIAGMLRVEVPEQRRHWEADQLNFVSGAAELAALAVQSIERRRAEGLLHRQQYFDTLTGLPNHDRLEHLLQRQLLKPGSRVVYALWCVGDLLRINENLGRSAGDALLQTIAARLDAVALPHIAARLGGSRFVLALLDIAPAEVSLEIEKTFYRLSEPVDLDGNTVLPQLSCGVSIAPQDAFTVSELLRHAEFALESARSKMDIPIEFYAPEPNTVAQGRYRLAGALPAALTRGEFELLFQPLVVMATREIVGVEALLRWHHPEKGEIPPEQFISIAEETGQIHTLGRFVIEDACRRLRGWLDRYGKPLKMAVNLSPLQLRDAAFLPFVEATLKEQEIDPAWLEIEISEAYAVELLREEGDKLQALRELGVSLTIDDFSASQLAPASLCRLPANRLKIDRTLVNRLPQQRQVADLVRVIVNDGKILGLDVVGEGVETDAQLGFLQELGCEFAQGHLFCKAVNAAGMTMLLERGLDAAHG